MIRNEHFEWFNLPNWKFFENESLKFQFLTWNNPTFPKNVWPLKKLFIYLQFAKKIVGKNSKKIRMNSKKFEKLLDWKFEIRFDSKAK